MPRAFSQSKIIALPAARPLPRVPVEAAPSPPAAPAPGRSRTPFAALPGQYDVIVADPPWPFRVWGSNGVNAKGAGHHYRVMTFSEIAALPVAQLARRPAILLLWCTGAILPQALAVMAAWGFRYRSLASWRKLTASGKPRMGTGFWCRSLHEPILVGTRGSPKAIRLPSLFDGIAREHSRKPEEFYDLVRQRTPNCRRLDLFAREHHRGFTAWGDEAGKFDWVAA